VQCRYSDAHPASISNRGKPTNNHTVHLELALLSHLFTVAIQEWGQDLSFNPALNIRKQSPGEGRDRRLSAEDERRLLTTVSTVGRPLARYVYLDACMPKPAQLIQQRWVW
jgi:hypothetical protein